MWKLATVLVVAVAATAPAVEARDAQGVTAELETMSPTAQASYRSYYDSLIQTESKDASKDASSSEWWCRMPWWCRRPHVYAWYRRLAWDRRNWILNYQKEIRKYQNDANKMQEAEGKMRKTIAQKKATLVTVTMTTQSLQATYAAAMEMLNAEKMRRTKLANEANRVVARLKSANMLQRGLNMSVVKLEKEIKRIKAEAAFNEARSDKLADATTQSLEESGKIAGQAAAKRVELKLLIDEEHDEIKASKQRLTALKDALADTQRRRNETRDAAVAATHEFERLVKAKEAAEAEAQGLEMKITTLEARYATAADEKRAAMDVAAKEMHEQQDAEDEDRKTSMHADSLSEEQLFVNRVLGENKEATAETEAQLAALGERRAQLLGEIGKLSNATAALRSRKERLEAHHDELRSNATALKDELAQERSSLADAVLKVKEQEATAERSRAHVDASHKGEAEARTEELGFAAAAATRKALHIETMAEGVMGFCDCSEDEEGCGSSKCGPHVQGTGVDAAAAEAATAAKLQEGAKKALEAAALVVDDKPKPQDVLAAAGNGTTKKPEAPENDAPAAPTEGKAEEKDAAEPKAIADEKDAAEEFLQMMVRAAPVQAPARMMRFREKRATVLRGSLAADAGADADADADAKDDPINHVPQNQRSFFTPPKRWRNWPWGGWCIWRKHKWCRYENYAWNLQRHYWWLQRRNWWLPHRRNAVRSTYNRVKQYYDRTKNALEAVTQEVASQLETQGSLATQTKEAKTRKDAIIKQMKEIEVQMAQAYKGLAAAQGGAERLKFNVEDERETRVSEERTLERTEGNTKKAEDIQAKASEDLAATRKTTLAQETQLRGETAKLSEELRNEAAEITRVELDLETATQELHSAQASRDAAEQQERQAKVETEEAVSMRDQKLMDKAKIEEEISATTSTARKAKEAAAASAAAIKAAKSSMAATQSEMRQLRAKLERTKAAMHAAGSAHALSSGDSASIGIAVRRLQDAVAEKEAESEVLRAQLARMAEETAVYQDQLDRAKVTREALQREVDEAKQRVSAAGAVARKEAKDADLAEAEREARASERDEMARSRGLMARTPLERMSELLKQRRALEGVLGGERAESTSKKLDEAEGEAGLLAKQLAEQEAAAAAAMAAEADKGKAGVSAEQEEDAVEKEAEDLVENPAAKDHEALEELAEATTVTPEDLPKDSASGDRQLDDMMGMGSALSAEEQAAEDKAANPAAAGEGEAAPASDNAGPAAVSGAASSAGEGSQDSQDAQNAMSDATGEDSSEEG